LRSRTDRNFVPDEPSESLFIVRVENSDGFTREVIVLEIVENQVDEVIKAGYRLELGLAQDRSLERLGERSLNFLSASELCSR
jgi:hypothetical protein